jgi:hypothetical protein
MYFHSCISMLIGRVTPLKA